MAAPDVVQADPEHYTVEAEDDRVRVLRVRYGGGEKQVVQLPATTHQPENLAGQPFEAVLVELKG